MLEFIGTRGRPSSGLASFITEIDVNRRIRSTYDSDFPGRQGERAGDVVMRCLGLQTVTHCQISLWHKR